MSLGRSSRFYLLGLAKVKSEKVLSSFASASSITIHHGSKLCYRTLDTDVGKTLMNVEMLKFLRARTSATFYHRHQLGLPQILRLCYNHSNSEFTLYCWVLPQLPESFPAFAFCSQLAPPMSLPFLVISKFIHCVVFNKVIHIIQVRVCHSTDPLQMIACDCLRLV